MRVAVEMPGDEPREALRSHVQRGLLACLAPHERRVRHASARLSELWGEARGCGLTLCRIEVELEGSREPVVEEALAGNPYRAADQAVAALGRALRRGGELAAA